MSHSRLKKYFVQLVIALLIVVTFTSTSDVTINAMPVNENFSGTIVGAIANSGGTLANQDWIKDSLGKGLNEREAIASQVVTEEFTKQVSNVEWLAPLAPVALSPFFGITLLAGLACFGPDWLPDNALLSAGSPLANPNLFWVFLVLTVLTSAPRFSKVSKPIAQMADFLETYSAIVILLVLKVMSMQTFNGYEPETAALVATQAGIFSVGWEGLMMLVLAINIIVINSVKFFFEILVWITPVPFLDACFEAANKSMCAGLMAIYALSPVLALAINIILFVCCALAFTWIRRRDIFFRTILVDAVMKYWSKTKPSIPSQLAVFPIRSIGTIPARAKCMLEKCDNGWKLTHRRLLRAHAVEHLPGAAKLDQGWWTNSVVLDDGNCLTFSSKFDEQLPQLASAFGFAPGETPKPEQGAGREIEFA